MDTPDPFDIALFTARRIVSETGFLPVLDDERLDPVTYAWAFSPTDGSIVPSASEPAERAVIAAGLHWLFAAGVEEEADRAECRTLFREFLRELPAQSIRDQRVLRWELHAAVAAADVDRVLALARRTEDIAPDPEHLALAARAIFLSIHPTQAPDPNPRLQDPSIQTPTDLSVIADLIVHSMATIVEPNQADVTWKSPSELDATSLSALLTAKSLLDKAELTAGKLHPTPAAIRCWCRFAVASARQDRNELLQTAKAYAALEAHPAGVSSEYWEPRRLIWSASARCFRQAGDYAHAYEAAMKWVEFAPSDSQARLLVSEALYKQGRIPEAVAAYEEWVRSRQEEEGDWQASLLLQLGLEVQDRRRLATALETAALTAPLRPHGESLVEWFIPWFTKLSPKARERWWTGLYTISSPHIASDIGDARWDQAADCFGEAVAFELKARVFRPFASERSVASGIDDHWRRVLAGRGTLGEMVQCLAQTKTPLHSLAKALAEWLGRVPTLRSFVQRRSLAQLMAVARLRGQAQHDSVTEAETRTAYAEAAEWMRALTSDALARSLG